MSCTKCDNKNQYLKRKVRAEIDNEYKNKLLDSVKKCRKGNKYIYKNEERSAYLRDYNNKKRATDINYKLRCNLRNRLYYAVKFKKESSILDLIGTDINGLKTYLQSKFSEGMNWDNYGKWHIDHIRPCISFDLTNKEEQKYCFHYTNLQPLWAKDNLSKGGTFSKTI